MGKRNKKDTPEKWTQVVDENLQSRVDREDQGEKVTREESVGSQELSAEEECQKECDELNDKYLRLYSDFENFRKRTIKEKGDLISNASAGVVGDLLVVLDDFERAIENNVDIDDPDSIKEGLLLIYNKFRNILEGKGLKSMKSEGDTFDIERHEAITNIPVENKELKGKVVDILEKGYYLNDKVLRYAKVVVGQ